MHWAAVILAASTGLTYGQGMPPDVSPDHWAHESVEELANKGLLLGYPDGNFLGNRTMTRYEMASLTQRLLRRLEQRIDTRTKEEAVAVPPPPAVTPKDLAEIRRLVEEFKVEMTVMGENMEKIQLVLAEVERLKGAVEELRTRNEATAKTLGTVEKDVAALKRLKFSGYIQSRYESEERPGATAGQAANAPSNGKFYVRRGRLKATYTGTEADYLLQVDAAQQNLVELKDAYIAWKLGSKPASGRVQPTLWFGQFNIPFGHEIEYSSSAREFPERSFAENALFPGERDRGIKFVYGLSPRWAFDASILNGGGINQPFRDDPYKDVTARIRGSLARNWNLGASGYWGATQRTTGAIAARPAVPGSVNWTDTNGNGQVDAGELAGAPGTPAVAAVPGQAFKADRTRFGVDTQLGIGGNGQFRGEAYWAPDHPVNNPATNPIPAVRDVKAFGWYALYVHSLGARDNLGVRYDAFDPNDNNADDENSRWNLAWNHLVGTHLRLTFSYEWFPKVPAGRNDDPLFTFQAQHKF